jgi:hypothetical protein
MTNTLAADVVELALADEYAAHVRQLLGDGLLLERVVDRQVLGANDGPPAPVTDSRPTKSH